LDSAEKQFPDVPVDDIEIQARENDLVLATHDDHLVFDDLTPIEKMDSNVATSPLTFFPPRPAITGIWAIAAGAGTKAFTAKNPPYGALLSYYLKEACRGNAKEDGEEKDKKRRGRGEIEDRHERRRRRKEGRQSKNHGTRQRRKVIREMDGPAPWA